MLSRVDFQINFIGKDQVKLNNLYQTLTGDLGLEVTVGELKALNKYLIGKQADLAGAEEHDAQFLDQDESVVDLAFLQKVLPKPQPSTGGSSKDRQLAEALSDEVRRLKSLARADNDYMLAKTEQLQRDAADHL